MKPQVALWFALRDLYANSWRLLLVNAAFGATLVALVLAALALPPAAILVVLAGPVLAVLVHCAVTVVRTESLSIADVRDGFRLHWLHGLELAAAGSAFAALGLLAIRFYGGSGAWPVAFLALYVMAFAGIYQLILWTLAVAEPGRPLLSVARDAGVLLGSRPGACVALGLVLLVVNLAGVAAAIMPFLTLTVAYTFLVAARFVLPPTEEEQV
jgi:hypothetical protein